MLAQPHRRWAWTHGNTQTLALQARGVNFSLKGTVYNLKLCLFLATNTHGVSCSWRTLHATCVMHSEDAFGHQICTTELPCVHGNMVHTHTWTSKEQKLHMYMHTRLFSLTFLLLRLMCWLPGSSFTTPILERISKNLMHWADRWGY